MIYIYHIFYYITQQVVCTPLNLPLLMGDEEELLNKMQTNYCIVYIRKGAGGFIKNHVDKNI